MSARWTRRGRTWTLRAGGRPVAMVRQYGAPGARYWKTVVNGRLNPFRSFSLQNAKDKAFLRVAR